VFLISELLLGVIKNKFYILKRQHVFGFPGRVAFFYSNALEPQLQKRQLSTPVLHSSGFHFFNYYYILSTKAITNYC